MELRYRRGLSVRDIAAGLGQPDKPLYRRMERIVATLRRAMTAAAEGPVSKPAPIDRSSNVWTSHGLTSCRLPGTIARPAAAPESSC